MAIYDIVTEPWPDAIDAYFSDWHGWVGRYAHELGASCEDLPPAIGAMLRTVTGAPLVPLGYGVDLTKAGFTGTNDPDTEVDSATITVYFRLVYDNLESNEYFNFGSVTFQIWRNDPTPHDVTWNLPFGNIVAFHERDGRPLQLLWPYYESTSIEYGIYQGWGEIDRVVIDSIDDVAFVAATVPACNTSDPYDEYFSSPVSVSGEESTVWTPTEFAGYLAGQYPGSDCAALHAQILAIMASPDFAILTPDPSEKYTSVDASGFLAAVIPECSIPPHVDVEIYQFRDGVSECANFARFVNFFGIPKGNTK